MNVTAQIAPAQRNALWLREWRVSSRLTRTPWLVAGTGLAMAAVLLLVAVLFPAPPSTASRYIFHTYFTLSALFVTLLGPAIAANTIALEREGKTWEALIMAGVGPRAIDRGKFLGAYTHLVVYLLALLPCAAIPHLFGGITYTETFLGIGMVFGLGALTVRFGLLMSAAVASTRVSLLLTLCASAVLCFIVLIVGAGATSFLGHDLRMHSLDGEGPVFWPVALVHEPWSFDYARYLLVVPIGGAVVVWFALRELTVNALSPAPSLSVGGERERNERNRIRRPLHLTYGLIAPALAILLALLPNRPSEIVAAQAVFSLFIFAAILVLGSSSIRSSLLLVVGGAGGMFVLLVAAEVVQQVLGQSVSLDGRHSEVESVLLYGSAFTVFLTGLAAYAHSRARTTTIARAVTAAVTFAIAVGPALAAVVLKVGGSGSSSVGGNHHWRWVLAASPIGALVLPSEGRYGDNPNQFAIEIGVAALGWVVLGCALLFATYRRENRRASWASAWAAK